MTTPPTVAVYVVGSRDEFGRILRDARKARGWSLNEATQHAGIAGVTVSSYERGDRNPPLSAVIRLAEAYGLRLLLIGTAATDEQQVGAR